MNRSDLLIVRARIYWERGQPLPLDLFAAMQSEGIDVPSLESKYAQ